jgi:iron complex transport system ATP-binding protein
MGEVTAAPPLLAACQLQAAYDGAAVLRGLNLELAAGEMVGLLGPNGSGKSTLLRVLAGLKQPLAGEVRLAGQPLRSYSPRRRAQLLALVPQFATIPFAFGVVDVVAMGRHPHLGLTQPLGPVDWQAVNDALQRTGCDHLRERLVTELSGGELQRVLIARALAQQPRALLLDEPTAHLDINHQLEIARLLRRLHRDEGLTVLWVSHDLNLAGEFCDRLLMLTEGVIGADGPPAEVLTADCLQAAYGVSVTLVPSPLSGRPQVLLSRGEGEG